MNERRCVRCDKVKPIEEFNKRKQTKHSERSKKCSECIINLDKLEFKICRKCGFKGEKNKFSKKENICKQCISSSNKEYRKANTDKYRSQIYFKKFGITLEEYEKILSEQDGVCKICKNGETMIMNGQVIALAVDHCHKTGKVRGLLCQQCNSGIGCFKDNIEIMTYAIKYLIENE